MKQPFGWFEIMGALFLMYATWFIGDRSLDVLANFPEPPEPAEWASLTCDDVTVVRYHDGLVSFNIQSERDE